MNTVYNMGAQAHLEGKNYIDNPHTYDSEKYRDWGRGWRSVSRYRYIS